MRVLVDDQNVRVSTPTIAAALAAARAEAESRGRVVIEATLDGVAIPDEALADPPTDEFVGSEVRFGTADPGELVGSTLRGVAEALEDATREQAMAAEKIQRGEMSLALNHVAAALAVWDQVRTAVINGTALLGLSVGSLEVRSAPGAGGQETIISVDGAVRSLAERLAEIKRAFTAQDWSALSDALAYDMQEQAAAWREILTGLAEQVESGVRARR